MDKKLEELLNTINFPEEEYSSFFNVSLKRVKVSRDKMRVILNSDIPLKLDYNDGTMYEAIEAIAKKYPNHVAFDFMGRSTTYKKMVEQIKN